MSQRFDTEGHLQFTCGYCSRDASGKSLRGALLLNRPGEPWHGSRMHVVFCPTCNGISVRTEKEQFPQTLPGPVVKGLPPDVADAYLEARRALGVSAPIASEHMCRKLLLHVAVEKGAAEKSTFAEAIAHLETCGYVTPPMKRWVEQVRLHGNVAAHRLQPPDMARALSTLTFTARLLGLIYEAEHEMQSLAPKGTP